jgi:hypothetical protein
MTTNPLLRIILCVVATSLSVACGSAQPAPRVSHAMNLTGDSAAAVARNLAQMVLLIDQHGRPSKQLAPTLEPVLERFEFGHRADLWGTDYLYRREGIRFELRSAGRDRTFQTDDDIVAQGQLGRSRPCAIRYESKIYQDPAAPACAPDAEIVIFPMCPALRNLRIADSRALASEQDSVEATGQRLVTIARKVDGLGREVGGVPPTLFSVSQPDQLVDAWGRNVRYSPAGRSFEVRSGGRDGRFDTGDDIIVVAQLGAEIECEFVTEAGVLRCNQRAPQCPGTSE